LTEAPFLVARGVSRRFGVQVALEPTDLTVVPGEVVALVGPNGAGKSTLLAILAGALPPDTGTVERADGLKVGWMPQRPAHYGRLTARENLVLFARRSEQRVLLLDEPTAALDPAQRRRLWHLAGTLRDEGGAVLVATHHHEELEPHADRVLELVDGRLA